MVAAFSDEKSGWAFHHKKAKQVKLCRAMYDDQQTTCDDGKPSIEVAIEFAATMALSNTAHVIKDHVLNRKPFGKRSQLPVSTQQQLSNETLAFDNSGESRNPALHIATLQELNQAVRHCQKLLIDYPTLEQKLSIESAIIKTYFNVSYPILLRIEGANNQYP